jgi:FlaA1/EpsC-like NDP-sugar epimerase
MIDPMLPPLDRHVVNRTESFFAEALDSATAELSDCLSGSRVLIIGGAGSIGSQTLQMVVQFGPSVVHVIDHNENGLAELIRGLRSTAGGPPLPEILLLPFDYGGAPFRLWMAANDVQYDHVLNFAALKHVRSEKDPYSVLAMLESNVLHLDALAGIFAGRVPPKRVFSVSTDKAANPSSMMGATKRLMEHALFAPTRPWDDRTAVSSARFANVAFSNGSLLQAWQNRLTARQPIACPEECRRFFVSLGESGQLCALAAFVGSDRTVSVPALDPGEHLVLLSDVAARFLEFHGLDAHFTHDPDEAIHRVEELASRGAWPVLLTPLDTGGEKPYEEFVGVHETVHPSRFEALLELDYLPPQDSGSLHALIEEVREMFAGTPRTPVTLGSIRMLIARVEPSFVESHRQSEKSLDQRI